MKIYAKKEANRILLFMGILFLLGGCSANTNQKNVDKASQITGSVIEDSNENCRFANESDCRPIEIRRGGDEKNSEPEIHMIVNKTNDAKKTELAVCNDGWQCVEKNYRAYQYANCSWVSIEYCVYGCKNDICNGAPICKPNSVKCYNDNVAKCNEDGSEWKQNESCDYLCESGVCINKTSSSMNATNSTNTNSSNNATNPTSNDYITDRCINIKNFNYNASGPDNSSNLNDEYFTLKNKCSYSIYMTNWTAKDATVHDFTFPSFNLGTNAEVTIHTGSGTDSSTDLYWGSGIHIWNNDKDTLYLNISNGTSVLVCKYNLTSAPCI